MHCINIMDIVLFPHPALKLAASPVLKIDNILRGQIENMFKLMYATNGIGLAGPQVELPYRLFVMNYTGDKSKPEKEMVFINPVIVRRGGQLVSDDEGCLSFPGIFAPVIRQSRVTIKAYSPKGEPITATFEGLAARCVQHEYDHLDGISFVDRLEPKALKKITPLLDKQIEKFNAGETIHTYNIEKPADSTESPVASTENPAESDTSVQE